MRCNVCQTVNIAGAVFCGGCGTPLPPGPYGGPPAPDFPHAPAYMAQPPPPPPPVPNAMPLPLPPMMPMTSAGAPPAPGSRPTRGGGTSIALIGSAFVVVLALVVVAFVFLGGDDGPTPSATPVNNTGGNPAQPAQGNAESEELPTVSSVDSPLTAPPTLAPVTTPIAPIATSPPPMALTTEGDLGLSTQISRPLCDGQYVTLIGASVDPANYARQIDNLLRQYPGSQYMKTALVCSSLRGQIETGAHIYVAFFGPFRSVAEACAARAYGPSDAYVKTLDNFTANNSIVSC